MSNRKNIVSLLALTAIAFVFALPLAAQTVVINDGFEVSYDGWTNSDGYTWLTAVRGEGYNSERAMMVTGRKTPQSGAVSDKRFWLDGGETYSYSVHVRHTGSSAETFNLTLSWLTPDGRGDGSEVIASATVQPNHWTRLTAAYATPRESVNPTFLITTNSTIDFYFDDFIATGRSAGLSKAMAAASTPANVGLKDIYANHFRVGNILNGGTAGTSASARAIQDLIRLEYNSITAENEHKPDATKRRQGSTNTNILAQVNSGAAAMMNFCIQHNIPMRGHVLAWHGQTPDWFFIQDINDARADRDTEAGTRYRNIAVNSVPWATPAVMDQRLESYIQNLFALYATQYPNLIFYAYDVVNEAAGGDGGVRARGFDHAGAGGQQGSVAGASPWQAVYGAASTVWIRNAFVFARRHAPAHTKLFYNDYNEWHEPRRDWIINTILRPYFEEGILDGMGMQGHVSADPGQWAWARWSRQRDAMDAYAAIGPGFEVQITELDVVTGEDRQWLNLQPERYRQIFEHAITVNARGGGQFTAICIWTINDANTWIRGDQRPALHDGQNNRKPAYTAVAGVVPESQWGNGNNPEFRYNSILGSIQPDANGRFFLHTYEGGTVEGWQGRGAASVANSSAQAARGSRSLAVTGREASWHGAEFRLDARAFRPGSSYSFSVMARQNTGSASDIQLTLSYSLRDTTRFAQVAIRSAASGQWTQLANTDFSIPAGASQLLLYVEMPDNATASFFIDDAMGGIAGALPPGGLTSAYNIKNAHHTQPLITVRGRTLNINALDDSEVNIRIVNLTGRTVASFNTNGRSNLSLRKIPAGMYMIEARQVKDGKKMTSNVVLR